MIASKDRFTIMPSFAVTLLLALLLPCGAVMAQYNPPNATPPIPAPPALRPATNSQLNAYPTNNTPSPATIAQPAQQATTTATTSTSPKNIIMPPSMDKIEDKRQLIVGDVINFRVVEDHEVPRSLPLNDSGEIEVPLLGRVPAAGKTLKKLAEELKVLFEKDYYYQATVLLSMDVTARSRAKVGKIYVLGQVRSPGAQDIPDDENYTVSKAILRAGGFGDFADKRKVKLVRKKTPDAKEADTTIVDCTEVFDKGDTSHDPAVKPEDLIIVPQRLINF